MKKLVCTFCALLVGPAISNAQALAGQQASAPASLL